MKLLVVESPSKAKTIKNYLGKDYTVISSIGHLRDLPKSQKTAIDIEGGFVPYYEIIAGKELVVRDLIQKARKADSIILAPDPDREGEAIAWHISEIIKERAPELANKTMERITFNAITKDLVQEAIKHPRAIDQNLRAAQEARRVLDRLVGYDLSGLIWKKVRYGLSAGRVQSPALRIILERERIIRAFVPTEFFILRLDTITEHGDALSFFAEEKLTDSQYVDSVLQRAPNLSWHITEIEKTLVKRSAKPPFTTSTLQQTASTRLGFSASRTMRAAQKLYESGHITYMRTDSPHITGEALREIASYITKTYPDLLKTQQYANKSKNAQEAHEAIRPSHIINKTCGNTDDERKLYELIWRRTVASQMVPADLLRTKVIASPNTKESDIPVFVAHGSQIQSRGWLLIDPMATGEETIIPTVQPKQQLTFEDISSEHKWTEAPNRYTEAGLIKELEKRGIGRPSTYASIIQTLIDREYVTREGRTLIPTDTGDVVSSFLENHFSEYISDTFTADMENKLDAIAEGKSNYQKVLSEFYTPFHQSVSEKESIDKLTNLGEADQEHRCPLCKSSMQIKLGRGGKFLSCSNYPDCAGSRRIDGQELGAGGGQLLGYDEESKLSVYLFSGRFGYYVQLGETPEKLPTKKAHTRKKEKEKEKEKENLENDSLEITPAPNLPRRASLPPRSDPHKVTLESALALLSYPRLLGTDPEHQQVIQVHLGRFGPYVSMGKEFRSLKKTDDPATITLDRALELLRTPKALPRGTQLVAEVEDPKGRKIQILESTSGIFIKKGLRRIYLPNTLKESSLTYDDIASFLGTSSKKVKKSIKKKASS